MNLSAIFTPMTLTIITLMVASFFFIQGKVRSDLVALCALLALSFLGILNVQEVLAGFSNSVVIMMIGLFVVGAGIFRTGLAKMISSKILRLAGRNENLLFILVMLVTAFIGAFISNTGTVAVMMPIVVSMAAGAGIDARRYLMPMAFASSMGFFTLISTPPNMVIQETLVAAGYDPLSFFSFSPMAAVALLVGMGMLFFLTKLLVRKEKTDKKDKKGGSLTELMEVYNLQSYMHKVQVPENAHQLVNKKLADLRITANYKVSISAIMHTTKSPLLKHASLVEKKVHADSVIQKGDVLYCHGSLEHIEKFAAENKLQIEKLSNREQMLYFQHYGVAEAYILPQSQLINHTAKETSFRKTYNVSVVGIRHDGVYQVDKIQDCKMHSGDALLLQGSWSDIAKLADRNDDIVLVGQPLKESAKITLDQKAPIAATIMLLLIAVMVFDLLPSVIAVLIAAVLMVFSGCLRNMEEAYHSINWESIVLIAAMLPMSTAFEKTGATGLIAGFLHDNLGVMGPYALLAGVYFTTSLMTIFMSNTATAVLLAPIALQTAVSMHLSPYPFLFAVSIGASMCFASPFSTPPNALVMRAGDYNFMDYVKVGLPLQVIIGIVMILILPLLFAF